MLKNFITTTIIAGTVAVALAGCSGSRQNSAEIQDSDVFGQAPAVVSENVELMEAPATQATYSTASNIALVPAIPVQTQTTSTITSTAHNHRGVDCSVLPTSKAGLAIYRDLCL